MGRFVTIAAAITLAACTKVPLCVGDCDSSTDPGIPGDHDADGDSITDADEGRFDLPVTDSDGDTIPDYHDVDSDDDTIPDIVEAGDLDLTTPPVDSDSDTTPDFRDTDSDDNGIPDGTEGTVDADEDGAADYIDPDNDGDGIDDVTEIGDDPSSPADFDDDGTPDHLDLDSDDDSIMDGHEGTADTDGDTIPDRHDLDSDDDTIPDETEAGDADPFTPPRDTDEDGTPDFRDTDSDGDCLDDAWERNEMECLDPFNADTDDDRIPDLIELAASLDPCEPYPGVRLPALHYFIMPYNDPADPPPEPYVPSAVDEYLVFSTDLQTVDIFLSVETSPAMSDEIAALQGAFLPTVVPSVRAVVPDVWFGLGRLGDCGSCTSDMSVLHPLTHAAGDVAVTLGSITDLCGTRPPFTQNLLALATGDVAPFSSWSGVDPVTCTDPGSHGWPCFRAGARPVIVQIGDASFDGGITGCSPATTHAQAISALNAISARYIGINSGSSRSDMLEIATGTGSVDRTGTPLEFDLPYATLVGDVLVDAIETLAHQVPVTVTAVPRDDPLWDTVDVVTEFIDHVEPDTVGGIADPSDPTMICVGGLEVADVDPPLDGRADSFTSLLPGTAVCFRVHTRQNWTVPPVDYRTYVGFIDIVADGISVVDTREAYFFVPPRPDCVVFP